jgi:hypothetical protein
MVACVGDNAFIKVGAAYYKCSVVEWDGTRNKHKIERGDSPVHRSRVMGLRRPRPKRVSPLELPEAREAREAREESG